VVFATAPERTCLSCLLQERGEYDHNDLLRR
jgi:hypothetical protein